MQNQSYALFHTKNVELADTHDIAYTMCQKVSLLINSNYSLSLDFVMPKPVSSATANVYLNNVLISTGKSTNYLVSNKLVYNFTANVLNN